MQQSLVFGDRWVTAELPDDTRVVSPRISLPLPGTSDLAATVREAVERPLELPPLTCHDAEDPEGITHLGTTPGGHDVEVTRLVAETDLTLYVNASTTRGFSGGWKSVCVGLSSYRSIRGHHTPDTMSLSTEKNRMHDIPGRHGAGVRSLAGRIAGCSRWKPSCPTRSRFTGWWAGACGRPVERSWR